MANEISEVQQRQFADNFLIRSQQLKSRLEAACILHPGIVGTSKDVDRVGSTTAKKKTSRNSDTPIIKTPFDRRRLFLYDWEWADLLDRQDLDKMADPTSTVFTVGVGALNRSKDDEIIAALGGNSIAISGIEGSAVSLSNIALPAGQKIAVGAVGLTKAKIIQARKILLANEAINDDDPNDALFWAVGAEQVEDLLGIAEVVSRDYNAIQPLVDGKLVYWMGFHWINTQRLVKTGTDRYTYAWSKSGVAVGTGKDIVRKLSERADKSYAIQPYASMTIGATRTEEEKVVEIACAE